MDYQIKYVTIDTERGAKRAARLHCKGWKIAETGLFYVKLYREKPTRMDEDTSTTIVLVSILITICICLWIWGKFF